MMSKQCGLMGLVGFLLVCGACSEPSRDRAKLSKKPETSGIPQGQTDKILEAAPVLKPRRFSLQVAGKEKAFALEDSPSSTEGLISVTPDVRGALKYFYETYDLINMDAKLQGAALDLDRDTEWLVTNRFTHQETGKSYRSLLVMDRRGEHYVVAKAWYKKGMDVSYQVLGHGNGDRAALLVSLKDGKNERVEIWQLGKGGVWKEIAILGIEPEIGVRLSSRSPGQIEVDRQGREESYFLRYKRKGFELLKMPKKTDATEIVTP